MARVGHLCMGRALGLALGLWAGVARAQISDCSGLGVALTEHSCFHARYGPWETVTATAGPALTTATPSVDAVHTQWLVRLPDGLAVVSYRPVRAGAWAVFVEPDALAGVLAPGGGELPVVFESRETACAFLPQVRVFELTAGAEYTLLFDGAVARESVIVIEKIDDFSTVYGLDSDGDGHGDPASVVISACLPPAGHADNDADCDDMDASIHPGAEDHCDGVDNDCDGVVDNPRGRCGDGVGRCQTPGRFVCDGGELSCRPNPAGESAPRPAMEACNGEDDDCNGVADDGALCDERSDAPVCAELGGEVRCGCVTDANCGGVASGRICDDLTRRCRDGCFGYPGRNGCASGEQCETEAPAAPGTCRALDAADPPLAIVQDAPRGCDCGVLPRPERTSGAVWAAGALLLGIVLCRRVRVASKQSR